MTTVFQFKWSLRPQNRQQFSPNRIKIAKAVVIIQRDRQLSCRPPSVVLSIMAKHILGNGDVQQWRGKAWPKMSRD